MKLRNKTTGEVIELKLIQTNCEFLIDHEVNKTYGKEISLDTLNKYYEDYEEKELQIPLVDSEEVRIAIRTWAEATNITKVIYDKFKDCIYIPECDEMTVSISFDRYSVFEKLEHGRSYTITELCGK